MMKHLVKQLVLQFEGCGTLRGWRLDRGSTSLGWAWRFYSLSNLLFPLYSLSVVAAKMIFFSVK